MQQVKAVVALAKGEPVQLTTINVPVPGAGVAVGRVVPGRPAAALPYATASPRRSGAESPRRSARR